MSKFLVIYHAPAEALAKMATMTEEEKMAGMKPWQDWMSKVGSALIDGGAPLMGGLHMNQFGSFSPSNREVTGYSMLEADDMEAAQALLEGHPHLGWDAAASIEVHECVQMM